jgi:hypothetical protein
MEKPIFEHDCEKCIFLGHYEGYDLYFCKNEPTVIARYGENGDYMSGLIFADINPVLGEAKRRAIELCLL